MEKKKGKVTDEELVKTAEKAFEEMNPFKILEIQDIEEGVFLANLNSCLRTLQARFIDLANHYKTPCKAQLIAKISLVYDPDNPTKFSLMAEQKWMDPPPPPITAYLESKEGLCGGHPGFAVPKSGTLHGNHPRQGKLFTQKGEMINQESGEVEEKQG